MSARKASKRVPKIDWAALISTNTLVTAEIGLVIHQLNRTYMAVCALYGKLEKSDPRAARILLKRIGEPLDEQTEILSALAK